MPNYNYRCSSCQTQEERFAHIDEELLTCRCGGIMQRQFSPPLYKPICDITPYMDENISRAGRPVYVESRQHKARLLKEHGLRMADSISDYR